MQPFCNPVYPYLSVERAGLDHIRSRPTLSIKKPFYLSYLTMNERYTPTDFPSSVGTITKTP